eukprot:619648-Pelagomonas_calceolata.AAC.1
MLLIKTRHFQVHGNLSTKSNQSRAREHDAKQTHSSSIVVHTHVSMRGGRQPTLHDFPAQRILQVITERRGKQQWSKSQSEEKQ